MKHKIIIAGGTGFLGGSVIKKYANTGAEMIVLTRKNDGIRNNIRYVQWDGETMGNWSQVFESSTAVFNFTGKSVNCRCNKKNKQEIIRSRVHSTQIIGKAIQAASLPPKVWINAGSAAIFGDGGEEIKNEMSPPGQGFSAEVCKQWEAAFHNIGTPYTRKVLFRIGLVFQKNTGLLQPFVKLAKLGLGGRMGSGTQYLSWIHEDDFLSIMDQALIREDFAGTIHCTSPFPVTNDYFMKALRKALNLPFGLPNPSFVLKAGSLLIQTEPELILTGRRVVSKLLQEKNIRFEYPTIETALNDLLNA